MAKLYGYNDSVDFAAKNLVTFGGSFTRSSGQPIDKYDCGIYKDFGKTNQLEMKTGVVTDQLTLLGIENYKDNSSIVTYTFFKDENDEYHFLSSEITS